MTTSSTIDSPKPAPKGYWIVFATVKEPSRFSNYTNVAGPLIASHGGRVLARGEVAVVVEGAVPGRPYLIEFPSYAAAQACFHSQGYQEAITLRPRPAGPKVRLRPALSQDILTFGGGAGPRAAQQCCKGG